MSFRIAREQLASVAERINHLFFFELLIRAGCKFADVLTNRNNIFRTIYSLPGLYLISRLNKRKNYNIRIKRIFLRIIDIVIVINIYFIISRIIK